MVKQTSNDALFEFDTTIKANGKFYLKDIISDAEYKRWFSSRKQGKIIILNKGRCGNGGTTGFIEYAKKAYKGLSIIVPNVSIVKSKEWDDDLCCLEKGQMKAALSAVATAGRCGVPWILDPAGVGVSRMRKDFVSKLVSHLRPAAIRGNASEILTLCGAGCDASGVDSAIPGSDAVEGAKTLAATLGTIVAVSGEVDYVTDGSKVEQITGGSPLMSSVTAMGCACTAVAGAALAVEEDTFAAVCSAMKLMSLAGSLAGGRFSAPGSFAAGFIDALYEISGR